MQDAVAIEIYKEARKRAAQLNKLPPQIAQTKLQVAPTIPPDFLRQQLPPSTYFAPDIFSFDDLKNTFTLMAKLAAYGIDEKVKESIDKELA